MRALLSLCILTLLLSCKSKTLLKPSVLDDLKTGHEQSQNTTATYEEAIDFYQRLSAVSDKVTLLQSGSTDAGLPLHAVVIDQEGLSTPEEVKQKGRLVLFINNGIHPGEPCGIDASMTWARNLVSDRSLNDLLDSVTFVIIPIYNVGGSLNRNSHSRANQVGPESYGFRGNARNLDLNRDFIKGDSYNSRSFQQLFTQWSPDLFIDNHTSNGADYQYVMTLIATQKDKLNSTLSKYMTEEMLPYLYISMEVDKYEMTPYVYSRTIPDNGIYGFMDYPRYSSGYAALHNTIGFISEAHMLKPYDDRVQGTYLLMKNLSTYAKEHKSEILAKRAEAIRSTQDQDRFELDWTVDTDNVEKIKFKGYFADYKPSEITGEPRLFYDRSKPWEREINYYVNYKPTLEVEKPYAYYVPQAYRDIVYRMQTNGVIVERLEEDRKLSAEMYYIDDYKTSERPYEGHYLHSQVKVRSVDMNINARKGDFLIRTNQAMNRYIVETLEPQAPDSWFAWNFFDGILMQKEYYSAYVFEDTAAELLKKDATLQTAFEAKKATDEDFASNARAQLDYIYKQTKHYEPTHNLYPVARVTNPN